MPQGNLTDLIDSLLMPAAALATLRAERAAIRDHTQGAYRALLTPDEPGGISHAERAAMAVRAARADDDPALAAHYADHLGRHGTAAEIAAAGTDSPDGPGRLHLLMRYADQVARHPDRVGQPGIDALGAAGLSPRDIVAATQLAAFVPYQVRLLAGLRALRDSDALHDPASEPPLPSPADAVFTMAEVAWTPRVPPVDAATATPEQLAALDACPPAVRRSTYFLTLALDPASLAERGALFNSVMYAPRGLPRADRELATAIVSMVNGCVYCTSVHARRYAELVSDPAPMQRLLDDGFQTPLDPRPRAIVDAAARLTATPAAFGGKHLVALRAAGLAPLELLDLIHAIAMFANANRLMQALGASVPT